ncbi:Hypothetical predicted protein [Lynx pardinus]|uniref:NXPE C-terminal domain-containing protein n=1 Tax=Lynx pardinus TaxID=191816 RepID=A0A485MUF3_LYNPA|nr:Hypothetical predicted protein [Lynx pardinus]
MKTPVPGGYTSEGRWITFCNQIQLNTMEINGSLKGTFIYLLGDSTLHHWIEHLSKLVKKIIIAFKLKFYFFINFFHLPGTGIFEKHLFLGAERHIQIQCSTLGYIPQETDGISDDKSIAIVITRGQHFRPFPIDIFICRAMNAQEAITLLFLRSPATKVIFKTENRKMHIHTVRFGNFRGYIQYRTTRTFSKISVCMSLMPGT